MTKTFEPVEPVERIPTAVQDIDVEVRDALPSQMNPEGEQYVRFRLMVVDQNGIPMYGENGDLSDHLDAKTYNDFMKAIEKFRKKAEGELIPK